MSNLFGAGLPWWCDSPRTRCGEVPLASQRHNGPTITDNHDALCQDKSEAPPPFPTGPTSRPPARAEDGPALNDQPEFEPPTPAPLSEVLEGGTCALWSWKLPEDAALEELGTAGGAAEGWRVLGGCQVAPGTRTLIPARYARICQYPFSPGRGMPSPPALAAVAVPLPPACVEG